MSVADIVDYIPDGTIIPRYRVQVNRILGAHRESGSNIVLPTYDGQRGNPALFSRALDEEVFAVEGDEGARTVIQQHPADVILVNIDTDIPFDIDLPEDFVRARDELETTS